MLITLEIRNYVSGTINKKSLAVARLFIYLAVRLTLQSDFSSKVMLGGEIIYDADSTLSTARSK
jgi:hypothetical protein